MSTHFHTLKVKEVHQLTDEAVEVVFDIPESLKEIFTFKAGQYLTLKKDIDGQEVRRSYSICSSPHLGQVSVAIKKVDEGKFSTYANVHLKAGDELEVMPPMGNFCYKCQDKQSHYLFIAAGSGITPIMSLMSTLLYEDPTAQVTLIYGNRNRGSIIFKEQIEALKNKNMDRMSVYHIFSREVADTALFNGRITKEKIKELTDKLVSIQSVKEAFICGPEEMILSVRDYLLNEAQLPQSSVHFELFSSPDQPRVVSEEWKKKLETLDTEQTSQVTVRLDGVAFNMNLKYGGDNILDAALKNGADLPYACKGGVCATCKAKLISGEVDMEVNYSLEPDEMANNFILTCQAHPRSPQVTVDFDYK